MSSTIQEGLKYNFEQDSESMENDYVATDIQWIYLNDQNSFNYSNGWVNFTNMNLIGASADKFFDWSQAYVVIPYTVSLTPTNCVFGSAATYQNNAFTATTVTPENAMAIAPKGNHHLIDLTYIKFNSISVNRGSNYVNFYENEKLKMMSEEEYKLFGDIMNINWDNADSYTYNAALLEYNNNLKAGAYTTGVTPSSFANTGHLNRILKNNFDYVNASSNYAQNTLITANTLTDTLLSTCYTNTTTSLVFQYTAVIPLAQIHDFYAKLPVVQNSTGFELRLQLNIAGNNSWTTTYACTPLGAFATPAGVQTPISITANQGVGHTCPFLLSQAGTNLGTGLSIMPVAVLNNTSCSITITPTIGWLNGQTTVSGNPCRIYVPQISYTPSYTQMLLKQPKFRLLYDDYYVDTILSVTGSGNVSKLFNAQLSRPRTLYIIPFLNPTCATTPANAVSPYLSCVSSAPNTSSICRIKNVQIQIGGQNIYIQPLQYNYDFYNNNLLPLLGKINGNSLKSRFQTGQITSSMWNKCYNTFTFDLQKCSDEIGDNGLRQFQINFSIDSVTARVYDFLLIVTYQNELYVDQVSGGVTSSKE